MEKSPEDYATPKDFILTMNGLRPADHVVPGPGAYVKESEIIYTLGQIFPYRIHVKELSGISPVSAVDYASVRDFMAAAGYEIAFTVAEDGPDGARQIKMSQNPAWFNYLNYYYVKDIDMVTLLKLKFG